MFLNGYQLHQFALPIIIAEHVTHERWAELDQELARLTAPEGVIFQNLLKFLAPSKITFSKIETMLSVRDSQDADQDDGIWHDDGSRVFAFSLSLTVGAHDVKGGSLELRKIGTNFIECIPTPEFGTAILFLTGVHGYEHRIRKVKKGRRIVYVGWCSI